jgi:hypothetical protein
MMNWDAAWKEKMGNKHKILIKEPLGISKWRWENNVKMGIGNVGCECGSEWDWFELQAFVLAVLNFHVL